MKNKLSNQEKHLAKLQTERENRRKAIEHVISVCQNLTLEERPSSFRAFAKKTGYGQNQIDLILCEDKALKQRVYEVLNPTEAVKKCYMIGVNGTYNTTQKKVVELLTQAEKCGIFYTSRQQFYEATGFASATVRNFLGRNPDLKKRLEKIVSNHHDVEIKVLPTVPNTYVPSRTGNTVQLSDTLRLVDLGGEIVAPCLNPSCQSRECVTQLQGWKDRSRYRQAHWALKGHLCRNCAGVMVGKYNKDKESVG